MRHRFGCALVILLSGSLCSCLNGQRYLDVQIERDGKVVLATGYGVSDALDAADMWQSLQGESFKSVSTVSPEADEPQLSRQTPSRHLHSRVLVVRGGAQRLTDPLDRRLTDALSL